MAKQLTDDLPKLMDAKQVAEYLKLHEVTVVAYARRGKLPGFKVGREWRFREEDIRAWVEGERQTFAQRFEALSDSIGNAMRRAGYGPDDVPRLIAEVREEHRGKRAGPRA